MVTRTTRPRAPAHDRPADAEPASAVDSLAAAETAVIGPDGQVPLPWLAEPLTQALVHARGHAVLLHVAPGAGALSFALMMAQAWLCEAGAPGEAPAGAPGLGERVRIACGRCPSCHLVQTHGHPDLRVQLPEQGRRSLGWLLPEDRSGGDDAKRKPSRQIRIDETRALIDWIYKTSTRGRGKIAVVHPATALNLHAANALLKTLEEPPAGTRWLLTAEDPTALLPTVRSRCQHLRLPLPPPSQARAWLDGQGVARAQALLAACSGRPLDALGLARSGVDAAAWAALPQALREAQAAAFSAWPVPQLLDALLKVCHDAMAVAHGAPPRFFPAASLTAVGPMAALSDWHRELLRVSRHAEHPWNEGLLLESLVGLGARALTPPPARSAPRGR